MHINTLRRYRKNFPKTPGIYIFRNSRKKPLYIGKAASLRQRISSYLRTGNAKIKKMVQEAKTLDFIEAGSSVEALIEESRLIKKYKPMFNIVMRDDKQYFYVAFTKEKFSRIFLTHQPNAEIRNKRQETGKTAQSLSRPPLVIEYIGPFTDGTALKTTLRVLRNTLPYCTCKQKHHVKCLNTHIGKCLGFCCLKNEELRTKNKEYIREISVQ